jgi:hypothetical protein
MDLKYKNSICYVRYQKNKILLKYVKIFLTMVKMKIEPVTPILQNNYLFFFFLFRNTDRHRLSPLLRECRITFGLRDFRLPLRSK